MIEKIRDMKDDLVDRKGHWVPILIAGVVVYVLLNIWPSFAIGLGIGVAGTWIYRMYFQTHNGQAIRIINPMFGEVLKQASPTKRSFTCNFIMKLRYCKTLRNR